MFDLGMFTGPDRIPSGVRENVRKREGGYVIGHGEWMGPGWVGRVLLALVPAMLGWSPGFAAAQDWTPLVEARGGAVYATSLAETPVRLDPAENFTEIGTVEVGAGVAPFLGAGVLFDVGHLVWAEVQGGVSFASARAEGPGGTWEAGSLTRFHAIGGLRVGLGTGLYVRGGVGFMVQSASDDMALFAEGDDTGILLAGAVGYQPLERLPISIELEAQRFDFGTTALRRAGTPDGSVGRVLLGIVWRPGSGEEE